MTLSSIVIKVSDVNSVSNSIEKKKKRDFLSVERIWTPPHISLPSLSKYLKKVFKTFSLSKRFSLNKRFVSSDKS